MYNNNPSLIPASSQAPFCQFTLQKSDFKTEYTSYEKLSNIQKKSNMSPILQTSSQTDFPQGRKQFITNSYHYGYQNSEYPENNQASHLLFQKQFQQLPQIKEDPFISFQKESEKIPSIDKEDQITPLNFQKSQPYYFQKSLDHQLQSSQYFPNEQQQINNSSFPFQSLNSNNKLQSLESILIKNHAGDQTRRDLSKNYFLTEKIFKELQNEQVQIKDINLKDNSSQQEKFSKIIKINDEQSILFSSNLLTEQKDQKDIDLSQEMNLDIQIYNTIQKIEGNLIEKTLVVDQIYKKTTFKDTYCLISSQGNNNQTQSLNFQDEELEKLKSDYENLSIEKQSMQQRYEKSIQDIVNSYNAMQTDLQYRLNSSLEENKLLHQQLTEENNQTKKLQILTDKQRESQEELEKQLKLFIEMNDSLRKSLSYYLSSSNQSQPSPQPTTFFIQNMPTQGDIFQQNLYFAPQPPPLPLTTPPSQFLNNFEVNEQKFDFEKSTAAGNNQNEEEEVEEEEECSSSKGGWLPSATKTKHIQKLSQNNNEESHKRNRKNIAQNFINAFRIFFNNKVEYQDLQDYLRQQDTSHALGYIEKLRNLYNSFLECNNPNYEFIIYLIQHKKLSIVFKFFIEQKAQQWIEQSSLHDKQAHLEQLEIFKQSFYSSIVLARMRVKNRKNQRPIQVPKIF